LLWVTAVKQTLQSSSGSLLRRIFCTVFAGIDSAANTPQLDMAQGSKVACMLVIAMWGCSGCGSDFKLSCHGQFDDARPNNGKAVTGVMHTLFLWVFCACKLCCCFCA
jgi:hypothetical protein